MMTTRYTVPTHTKILRFVIRPVFRGIFHLLSHVQITGLENIPPQGPYLIAMNHISLYEPPFILSFWPTAVEAVGAVDIWSKTGQSILARMYGGIQVHRGQYDRQLIETMVAALRSGRSLVIAPEGGRSHVPGMRRALPGVAYVMDLVQAPVVPVGIVGATDDFMQRALRMERPRLEMRIGKPICLPPIEGKGEARRSARQCNVDRIMIQIGSLLPVEYRGVYAEDTAKFCAATQTAQ